MTMTRQLLLLTARQSIRCYQTVPGGAFHNARSLSALRSFSSNNNKNVNSNAFSSIELKDEALSMAQPQQGVSQISNPFPSRTGSGSTHEDEYGDEEEVTDIDGYRHGGEHFKNMVEVRMPDMGDSDGTYPRDARGIISL